MTLPCIAVTGASRGIGAAIAQALLDQGFTVACLSRSGTPPPGSEGDPRAIALQADVTERRAVESALAAIAGRGLQLGGLVNNAGVHREAISAELPLEQWREVLETNATSVLVASQAAYPYLRRAGGGLVVNIGSFFDRLGVKRNLAYCASKAAVGAITRCLAVEWASAGIRVVNVAPGYIETDLNAASLREGPLRAYLDKRIPGGRPGQAAEVGRFVAALYAADATFLTGATLYLDGAQGIAH